jgi:phosphoribosylformylglycinamidine synthase
LSGTAPEYDRPFTASPAPPPLGPIPDVDPVDALLRLVASPNHGSRAWVWRQYDHQVMADTIVVPGSDAGVVRVHGTQKAIAFTSDVTPRYCRADPERGGMQAVAEAYRNLTATGARPLAATDNLNFGNPERPEIMGQLVGCIRGIAAACTVLDMPIVSGNVSLYNETEGAAILPTPTIGAVGLLATQRELIGMAPAAGDALLLLGETRGHLGQSALLAELFCREEGAPPPVDLAAEKAAGDFVRAANAGGLVTAAHDLSDGGLALAAAEMALAGATGVRIEADADLAPSHWFFGEDQSRYLLACRPEQVEALAARAAAASLPLRVVGSAGGDRVALGDGSVGLAELAERHAGALARLLD